MFTRVPEKLDPHPHLAGFRTQREDCREQPADGSSHSKAMKYCTDLTPPNVTRG